MFDGVTDEPKIYGCGSGVGSRLTNNQSPQHEECVEKKKIGNIIIISLLFVVPVPFPSKNTDNNVSGESKSVIVD